MVARARRPGYGAPLGDDGRLAEGNDGVLVLQAPVVVQRVQPSLPDTATASSASVTVQLLSERNTVGGKSPRSHSADAEFVSRRDSSVLEVSPSALSRSGPSRV